MSKAIVRYHFEAKDPNLSAFTPYYTKIIGCLLKPLQLKYILQRQSTKIWTYKKQKHGTFKLWEFENPEKYWMFAIGYNPISTVDNVIDLYTVLDEYMKITSARRINEHLRNACPRATVFLIQSKLVHLYFPDIPY